MLFVCCCFSHLFPWKAPYWLEHLLNRRCGGNEYKCPPPHAPLLHLPTRWCNLSAVFLFFWQRSLWCVLTLMQHWHLVGNHCYFRWLGGLLKVWLFRPAGVLPQTGLKWAEMVLNKSCLSLVQKYLKRCSRDRAALLLPVPLNRKGIANFKTRNCKQTIHCWL